MLVLKRQSTPDPSLPTVNRSPQTKSTALNFLPSSMYDRAVTVTGASAGLGLAIAKAFLESGHHVVGVGRDEASLTEIANQFAAAGISKSSTRFIPMAADVSDRDSVYALFQRIGTEVGRIDVLVNCVGQSDRGTTASLSSGRLAELMTANVTTALLCAQAALPLLKQSRGVVVNIGSLASKVGARHLGGYPAAKHALAGLTQQMRLEWCEYGIHVALVSPGPIRREDAGLRYQDHIQDSELPASASRPGGGTSLKGLEPSWVAAQVLRCVERRSPDVILPRYARTMIVLGHISPRLGDWLLLWMTK